LLDGLRFPEGPRWHEGELWFSDMHARQVMKLDLDGHAEVAFEVPNDPSGLGWLPDGRLLVVSMRDRKLLRLDPDGLHVVADLSAFASFDCNDMVVDGGGRAYVGNFGFDLHGGEAPKAAELICVEPDGSARVVADDLLFPNGTVITPDGKTLIVGESWGGRLTAFDIDPAGNLSNRRLWAKLPDGAVPDGICLDAHGGIWSASPASNECLRQVEGGQVTHRVAVDQGAFACMLGGDDGRSLFILTAGASDPDTCRKTRTGRVELAAAPFPRAGWP
ncbi:MAG: hypothetical protein EP301_08395, partial [Gammaproteobacteria bacterium]